MRWPAAKEERLQLLKNLPLELIASAYKNYYPINEIGRIKSSFSLRNANSLAYVERERDAFVHGYFPHRRITYVPNTYIVIE